MIPAQAESGAPPPLDKSDERVPSVQTGLTTAVVVSHCSAATIQDCLRAVLSSSAPLEVVVVDNASDDATRLLLAEQQAAEPLLAVVLNDENRRFASACNQGAAVARGETLLFLNPDAFVKSDTVRQLGALLAANPDVGLLGCGVQDENGRPHGPQRRREPNWRRSLASLTGLSRLEGRFPSLSGIEDRSPLPADAELIDVDAVNGALMLVRRAVFQRIGGFDEGFLLHAEDLDLCRRIRHAGFRVCMAPRVTITHIGGVSSRRRRVQVEWWKTQSLWRYFRKHDAAARSLPVAGLVALGLAARYVLTLPRLLVSTLRRK